MGAPRGKRKNSKDTISFRFSKSTVAKMRNAVEARNMTLTDFAEKCIIAHLLNLEFEKYVQENFEEVSLEELKELLGE